MGISEMEAVRVADLMQDTRSQRDVAQFLGISQSCVRRLFLETGSYILWPGTSF